MDTFHCIQSKPGQKCQVSTPTGSHQKYHCGMTLGAFKLSIVSSDEKEIKINCGEKKSTGREIKPGNSFRKGKKKGKKERGERASSLKLSCRKCE